MHGGVNVTLTAVHEKYWILKDRQVVKSILCSCVICKKLEGPAYSTQPSPDLPDFRVSDDPPFADTRIDLLAAQVKRLTYTLLESTTLLPLHM